MTTRHMLVVAHTARQDALAAAVAVCEQLRAAGATPVVAPVQEEDFRKAGAGELCRFLAQAYLWMISSSLSCWVAMEPSLALSN